MYHILSDHNHDFNYDFRDIAYDFKTPHTTLSITLQSHLHLQLQLCYFIYCVAYDFSLSPTPLTKTLRLHLLFYCDYVSTPTLLVTTLRFQLIHRLIFCILTNAFNSDFTSSRTTFRLHMSLMYHKLTDRNHDFNYDFKTLHMILGLYTRLYLCLCDLTYAFSYDFAISTDTLHSLLYPHICL